MLHLKQIIFQEKAKFVIIMVANNVDIEIKPDLEFPSNAKTNLEVESNSILMSRAWKQTEKTCLNVF